MTTLLSTTSYGVQLLQTLGALLIVCTLAFMILRFVARRGLVQLGDQRLKLTASLPVGQRQRVAIVKVDGVELLVGISEHGVSLLRELPARIESDLYELGTEPGESLVERIARNSA